MLWATSRRAPAALRRGDQVAGALGADPVVGLVDAPLARVELRGQRGELVDDDLGLGGGDRRRQRRAGRRRRRRRPRRRPRGSRPRATRGASSRSPRGRRRPAGGPAAARRPRSLLRRRSSSGRCIAGSRCYRRPTAGTEGGAERERDLEAARRGHRATMILRRRRRRGAGAKKATLKVADQPEAGPQAGRSRSRSRA